MRLNYQRLAFDMAANLIKSGTVVATIILAVNLMSQGSLSVGGFSAVISILTALHASTGYFIGMVGGIYTNWKELSDVTAYYQLEQDTGETYIPEIPGIRLENVSFRYPGRESFAVSDVNLDFKRGEKIAILGFNGAGKTTLVNMLLGLYQPTKGRIIFGGSDIAAAEKDELYKQMTGVFQDFQVFNLSIGENVQFGLVEKRNDQEISTVLELAGFNLAKYPRGIKTAIGREFNGVNLSRGECQQIAIARSYYNKDADIIVIDEPTAALDPIAEEKLYKKFLHNTGNKTTFIVSHRLGSVKIADRILVMDSGEIVEDGSHQELLRAKGLYAQMYEKQAALYNR